MSSTVRTYYSQQKTTRQTLPTTLNFLHKRAYFDFAMDDYKQRQHLFGCSTANSLEHCHTPTVNIHQQNVSKIHLHKHKHGGYKGRVADMTTATISPKH